MRLCNLREFILEVLVKQEINLSIKNFKYIEWLYRLFQKDLIILKFSGKMNVVFDINNAELKVEEINIQNSLHLKSINKEIFWKYSKKINNFN